MAQQTNESLVDSRDELITQDSPQAIRAGAGSTIEPETPPHQNQIRYVPAGTGPAYWGPGDKLTFLITGKETAGAFFLAEMSVPPGGGPPPHIHHCEDEAFQVLEGTLTIYAGGNTIVASPGDFAFLPRGIVHCFKNNGDATVKALVLVTPAGLENFFSEGFDPALDRSAPPPLAGKEMISRLLSAAPRYGLEFLPPA
jgi:quercetin dioxygenase-like cupin family protein